VTTPHLVLHLRDSVPGESAHFALVRLRADALREIVDRAEAMPAERGIEPRIVRESLDPALVSLHHEDETRHIRDVLVLAAFAHVENLIPGRLTLPEGVVRAGPSPDHAQVELFRNGNLRFNLRVQGATVRTSNTTIGLLAYAALWMATPEEEGPALDRLARLDPELALRALERGVELYRIGARRALTAHLSEQALGGLLEHTDPEVRLRTLTLLRRALPTG